LRVPPASKGAGAGARARANARGEPAIYHLPPATCHLPPTGEDHSHNRSQSHSCSYDRHLDPRRLTELGLVLGRGVLELLVRASLRIAARRVSTRTLFVALAPAPAPALALASRCRFHKLAHLVAVVVSEEAHGGSEYRYGGDMYGRKRQEEVRKRRYTGSVLLIDQAAAVHCASPPLRLVHAG
jgi:hypothetical protein